MAEDARAQLAIDRQRLQEIIESVSGSKPRTDILEIAVTFPRLTIIAGANGCGKTTLTGWNRIHLKDSAF